MAAPTPWIDLRPHDERLRLIIIKSNGSRDYLLLVGAEHYPEAAEQIGFVRQKNGAYIKADTTRLSRDVVASFRQNFPNLQIRPHQPEEVNHTPQEFGQLIRSMRAPSVRPTTTSQTDNGVTSEQVAVVEVASDTQTEPKADEVPAATTVQTEGEPVPVVPPLNADPEADVDAVAAATETLTDTDAPSAEGRSNAEPEALATEDASSVKAEQVDAEGSTPIVADEPEPTIRESAQSESDPEGSAGADTPAPAEPITEPEIKNPAQASVADAEDRVIDRGTEEDSLQADYKPYSSGKNAGVKIPKNLARATSIALSKVQNAHGDIDKYVADKMQVTVNHLHSILDAEQIDAVALVQHAFERDRNVIDGDAAGMGKGRVLAANIQIAINEGRKVLFFTEKANLFTDLYRDMEDIGVIDKVKMLSMNAGASIYNQNGDLAYKVSRKEASDIAELRKIPDDINLVVSTYSQIRVDDNSSEPDSPATRLELFRDYVKDQVIIADEADIAAGNTSKTNHNIKSFINLSANTVFSSATSIRDPKAVELFDTVFPEGVGGLSVAVSLQNNGEPAQEAISEMLAEDGVLIVREHDFSQLSVDFHVDAEVKANAEYVADRFSEVMSGMMTLSRDIGKMVDDRNFALSQQLWAVEVARAQKKNTQPLKKNIAPKMGKLASSYTHFGSKLYNLNRVMLLGLNVNGAIERARIALESGKKPVIVLDNTIASLLVEAQQLADEMDDNPIMGADPSQFVNFQQIMRRLLDKITKVREYDKNLKRHVYRDYADQDPAFITAVQSLESLIDNLPDVDVTPIDTIHRKLSDYGFKGDEITGRKLCVVFNDDDTLEIEKRSETDRNQVISDFNNGNTDYVVLNRAALSGISLHASPKFNDTRPRKMIFVQVPDQANAMKQVMGRIYRKDQVEGSVPEFEISSTGLPIEFFYGASVNNKIKQMSACTTSNRDSYISLKYPDVLNPFGNEVAKEFLIDNDTLADKLAISVNVDEDDHTNYIRTMLGRIQLMKVNDQHATLEAFTELFTQRLDELAMIGINPVKSQFHDWRATVEDESVLPPMIDENETVFDRPVNITKLNFQETVYPQRYSQVEKDIKLVSAELRRSEKIGKDDTLETLRVHLETHAYSYATDLLLSNQYTLQDALSSPEYSPAKRYIENIQYLTPILEGIAPGSIVRISDPSGYPTEAVVANFRFSGPRGLAKDCETFNDEFDTEGADLGRLYHYVLELAIPGEQEYYRASISSLRSYDPNFAITGKNIKDNSALWEEKFDSFDEGVVDRNRTVLTGNIFQASQMANYKNGAMTFTDEGGSIRRAVVLSKDLMHDDVLRRIPQPVRKISQLHDIIDYANDPANNLHPSTGKIVPWISQSIQTVPELTRSQRKIPSASIKVEYIKGVSANRYTFSMPRIQNKKRNYDESQSFLAGLKQIHDQEEQTVEQIAATGGDVDSFNAQRKLPRFTLPVKGRAGSFVTFDTQIADQMMHFMQKEMGETFYVSANTYLDYMQSKGYSADSVERFNPDNQKGGLTKQTQVAAPQPNTH